MVGIAIAQGSLHVVRLINPGNIPRLETIEINASVTAFTFGVSLSIGILFGLAPVWSAVKLDLNTALKSGGRSGHEGGGLRLATHRLRGLLVVSELAFSVILLIGAGLLIRSFFRIQAVAPGFATDHIITMRVVATGQKYREDSAVIAFYRELSEKLRQLPGIQAFGFTSVLPLTGTVSWGGINVEGFTAQPGQELQADLRTTDAHYFSTMKIPLIAGRFFSDHDTNESERVAMIDQKFAQRFWPNGDAVGKHVWFDPKKPVRIAGVVGNVKQYGLDSDTKIAVYLPNTQSADNAMYVAVRAAGDPAALVNPITASVHAVEPTAVVYDANTMDDRLYRSLARQRFASALLGSFAVFAMVLAGVGVYGVISYLVAQNTHEIGIRAALGARWGNILAMVVKQGLSLAGAGIFTGLIGALALTRVMASLLFGVSALDWVTFSSVALLLAPVAFAATVIPAFRAIRIDPTVALRED